MAHSDRYEPGEPTMGASLNHGDSFRSNRRKSEFDRIQTVGRQTGSGAKERMRAPSPGARLPTPDQHQRSRPSLRMDRLLSRNTQKIGVGVQVQCRVIPDGELDASSRAELQADRKLQHRIASPIAPSPEGPIVDSCSTSEESRRRRAGTINVPEGHVEARFSAGGNPDERSWRPALHRGNDNDRQEKSRDQGRTNLHLPIISRHRPPRSPCKMRT